MVFGFQVVKTKRFAVVLYIFLAECLVPESPTSVLNVQPLIKEIQECNL